MDNTTAPRSGRPCPDRGAGLKTPAAVARIWCNCARKAHLDGAGPAATAA